VNAITTEDFQFLIVRLNGVAGTLMNHGSGTKAITPEKAKELYDTLVSVADRLRHIREGTAS
jgi:hypothetical protein